MAFYMEDEIGRLHSFDILLLLKLYLRRGNWNIRILVFYECIFEGTKTKMSFLGFK